MAIPSLPSLMHIPSPCSRLQLGFAGATGEATPHLSVDGMTPLGPNLSHWPGNRTPARWRADLSTGICLRFARAASAEQATFLGDAELVVNDHFDSDGFGSLLAVLRPDVAFAREELLLAVAATGDYGTWHSWRAFAIDRIVGGIARPDSPASGVFFGITDPDQLSLQRYAWLLENATAVLDHTGQWSAIYATEMALVKGEIERGLAGDLERRRYPQFDLAVLTSQGGRHRMTLNTLAGGYRVLHVQHDADGTRYRYHDRTESWFELVTFHPLARRDLRPLAAQLAVMEPAHDGAAWNADAPTAPIPELYFGVPSGQAYGQVTRDLRPSQLSVEAVVAAFAAFFASPSSP